MEKVLELNNILDEEIQFCEKFEELLLQKKELLIHSKATALKDFDERIYEAQAKLQQITQNRLNVTKKFGNEQMKLSEIIGSLEDKTAARELEIKRKKIQISAQKISLINKVINSLIEHSLKVIDGSILAIANAIAATQTKGDYYNGYGIKERQEGMTISAIVEDA